MMNGFFVIFQEKRIKRRELEGTEERKSVEKQENHKLYRCTHPFHNNIYSIERDSI